MSGRMVKAPIPWQPIERAQTRNSESSRPYACPSDAPTPVPNRADRRRKKAR